MKRSFKDLLKEGNRPLGIFVNTGSPEMIEITAQAGFDFVFIDNEHGGWDGENNAHLIRAAESFDSIPLVRVPNIDETAIKYALDCGAAGIVIPGVSSVDDAKQAIEYAKFMPDGRRGACPYVRANKYVGKNSDFFVDSNKDVAVVLLIEGANGIAAYDDIINLPDVDCVFFGPYDMSVSLGIPGQVDDPKVKDAIKEMIKKANDKGVYAGMLGITTQSSKFWFECGADYIVGVGDMALFYEACKGMVDGIRK